MDAIDLPWIIVGCLPNLGFNFTDIEYDVFCLCKAVSNLQSHTPRQTWLYIDLMSYIVILESVLDRSPSRSIVGGSGRFSSRLAVTP